MSESGRTVLLAGFSDDLSAVKSQLGPLSVDVATLDETTPDDAILPRNATVVYVFSRDTGYSSQLMSWFAWVHDKLNPRPEYLMGIGGIEAQKVAFEFLAGIPEISIDELREELTACSS